MAALMDFGVAANHADSEETGWIIVCGINKNDPREVKIPCKSVYAKRSTNDTSWLGSKFWMLRLKVEDNFFNTSLIPYN